MLSKVLPNLLKNKDFWPNLLQNIFLRAASGRTAKIRKVWFSEQIFAKNYRFRDKHHGKSQKPCNNYFLGLGVSNMELECDKLYKNAFPGPQKVQNWLFRGIER